MEPRGGDIEQIRALPNVEGIARGERTHRVRLREGADGSVVLREIAAMMPLRRIELIRPNLEEIFLRLARPDAGAREAS